MHVKLPKLLQVNNPFTFVFKTAFLQYWVFSLRWDEEAVWRVLDGTQGGSMQTACRWRHGLEYKCFASTNCHNPSMMAPDDFLSHIVHARQGCQCSNSWQQQWSPSWRSQRVPPCGSAGPSQRSSACLCCNRAQDGSCYGKSMQPRCSVGH